MAETVKVDHGVAGARPSTPTRAPDTIRVTRRAGSVSSSLRDPLRITSTNMDADHAIPRATTAEIVARLEAELARLPEERVARFGRRRHHLGRRRRLRSLRGAARRARRARGRTRRARRRGARPRARHRRRRQRAHGGALRRLQVRALRARSRLRHDGVGLRGLGGGRARRVLRARAPRRSHRGAHPSGAHVDVSLGERSRRRACTWSPPRRSRWSARPRRTWESRPIAWSR